VAAELNSRPGLKDKFHAAVAGPDGGPTVCPQDAIVILPADIGLRIQLPKLEVAVDGKKDLFCDCTKVYAKESGELISYLSVE
jgi:hypothetical protein